MTVPRFSLRWVVAMPAALALLAGAGENPAELLARHQNGDRGVVSLADTKENDFFSMKHALGILSSYAVGHAGEKVWIITKPTATRCASCFLKSIESREGGARATLAPPPLKRVVQSDKPSSAS